MTTPTTAENPPAMTDENPSDGSKFKTFITILKK